MLKNETHQEALKLFEQGDLIKALDLFKAVLQDDESSEVWNDWATIQFRLGQLEEAVEGFRRALELDADNTSAAVNLGVLLSQVGRSEAISWLEKAISKLEEPERTTLSTVLAECRDSFRNHPSSSFLEEYLLTFAGKDDNEASYLQTHISRYVSTLELLPQATPGQTLLELGAAFHHLTPALRALKGYEVRCSDVWEGEKQTARVVESKDGSQKYTFVVDNFDVEKTPWPYPDRAFDVVLCCEMLEHLISDPMGVISEINRVLRPTGVLLLTTPNMASAKSVEYALRGESPYIYGRYEPGGRPTDHHNREYTTNEVERLLEVGGFRAEKIFTQDSWWTGHRSLLRMFASRGLPVARRGDNTFCLARKTTAVAERYPEEFYLKLGTQAERREQQTSAIENSATEVERPQRILIVNELLPQTDRNGSDVRLMQILRELREQGHEVTYLARSGQFREYYTTALKDLGIKVFVHDATRLRHLGVDDPPDCSLEQILKGGSFDLAILLMWFWSGISVPEHYMGEIRRLSPNTRIAVLTDDQHGLRELRMAQLNGKWADYERAEDFTLREFEAYAHADIVLSISEDDRRGLITRNPDLNVSLMPMTAEIGGDGPGFAERTGFLFLGNFSNAANRDGAEWLLHKVWPQVRAALPDATLSLAGSNFPAGFGAQYEGVRPIGHVKDLQALFAEHKVFVAPIRFGTGIKTKNLSALGYGLPLVTTTVGAEGINLSHGSQALIADQADYFATCMMQAYTDENLWSQLVRQGKHHVSSEFGQKRLHNAVHALVGQARQVEPRVQPPYSPSYLLAESQNPLVLNCRPTKYRNWLRLAVYLQLAQTFISEKKLAAALEQLHHIFAVPREGDHGHVIFDRALALLSNCYEQMGNTDKAFDYDRIRQRSELSRQVTRNLPQSRRQIPDISVILPTYNRADRLELCLTHLAAQSLPADQWEVIVVDDGSLDRTSEVCAKFSNIFNLTYIKQANAGIGSARRAAAHRAQGQFLLLIKDDTISSPTMLAEHLQAQYALNGHKAAILGSRCYSQEAAEFALGLFVAQSPLFFAQSVLPPDLQVEGYYFMASNLSIAKQAVLDAGSFDPEFRIAEDIELGIRLRNAGYQLHKHPEIKADHHHLAVSLEEFVSKARRYGEAQSQLFRKHISLIGDGTGPFGRLDRNGVKGIKQLVERIKQQAKEATKELEKATSLNLHPYISGPSEDVRKIEDTMRPVRKGAPVVFWYQFFESFLEAWKQEKARAAAGST